MIEKPKGKYTPGLDKLVDFCFEIVNKVLLLIQAMLGMENPNAEGKTLM